MFRYPKEKNMVSNNRRPKKPIEFEPRVELISPEIEFEPLEETYPSEEDSFCEMFHRLERDRSLGHDESYN